MYFLLGIIFVSTLLLFLGREDPLLRDKKIQEKLLIREEREKRLKKPLVRLLDRGMDCYDPINLIEELKRVSQFSMDREVEDWLKQQCRDGRDLVKVFQIIMQRGLNSGRTHATGEDLSYISKYINFHVIHAGPHPEVGATHTLGIIHGRLERIKIHCAAIPVGKGRGTITSVEGISIHYPPLEQRLKDFDLYLKFYPDLPENDGDWEAALILAIVSALTHRVVPVDYVLGGVDSEGIILPPPSKMVESLKEEERAWVGMDDQGGRARLKSSQIIPLESIQEALSLMHAPPELESQSKQRDFLSNY